MLAVLAVFVCQSLKRLFLLLFSLSQWQRPCVQSSVTVGVLGLTWATAAIGSAPAAAPAPRTPTASYVQLHPASSYVSLVVSCVRPCLQTQAPASVSRGPPPSVVQCLFLIFSLKLFRFVCRLMHRLSFYGAVKLCCPICWFGVPISVPFINHSLSHTLVTPPPPPHNWNIVAVIHMRARPIQLLPSQPVSPQNI